MAVVAVVVGVGAVAAVALWEGEARQAHRSGRLCTCSVGSGRTSAPRGTTARTGRSLSRPPRSRRTWQVEVGAAAAAVDAEGAVVAKAPADLHHTPCNPCTYKTADGCERAAWRRASLPENFVFAFARWFDNVVCLFELGGS